MHEQEKAILQSLVSVAWADGDFADREKQMLDALIEAFSATEAEATELREYADTKRTLEDIPITSLSAGDRRNLLHHAVMMTWIDGAQHEDELALLSELIKRLNIPEAEAKNVMAGANEKAKTLLNLLQEEEEEEEAAG